MNILDPLNLEGIWNDINNHSEQLNNKEWGIWRRIENLEQKTIPELHEKFGNPDWGVWGRLENLEKENAELKKRVSQLESLAGKMEEMLIKAVNNQLGNNLIC